MQLGVPPGPLESTSAPAAVLFAPDQRPSVIVQYVGAMPLNVNRPDATVTELDALLRSLNSA